jgi:hypothetical protein
MAPKPSRSPEVIAAAVVSVTLTVPVSGVRRVGKNVLAEAVLGDRTRTGGKREGRVIWKDVLGRGHCRLPAPECLKERLEGAHQATEVFDVQDVPCAVRKLLGVRRAAEVFVHAGFAEAVKELFGKCGAVDLRGWDTVLAEVRRELDDRSSMLAPFRCLPAMLGGASSSGGAGAFADFRTEYDEETETVIVALHDELKWLGIDRDGEHSDWKHWLGAEVEAWVIRAALPGTSTPPVFKHYLFPGDKHPTPAGCRLVFRHVVVLCMKKSKIATEFGEKALDLYARYLVKDQRLVAEIEEGAAAVPVAARAFVVGAEEAAVQQAALEEPKAKRRKTEPLDVDEMERRCLEDPSLDLRFVERRLAIFAMARRFREQTSQQLALADRIAAADVEVHEAEAKSKIKEAQAEAAVRIAGLAVEKEKKLVEKQAIEDQAKADAEERERQRVHAAELAIERRRAEVQEAASKGEIPQDRAAELLAEERRTPILGLERWLSRCVAAPGSCRCDAPSRCSSELARLFNEGVRSGRHVKTPAHWNSDVQRWRLFEEHDGAFLRLLHLEIHDRRNHVRPGQTRLQLTLPVERAA